MGQGGEKKTFAETKNMCSNITEGCLKKNSMLYNSQSQPGN